MSTPAKAAQSSSGAKQTASPSSPDPILWPCGTHWRQRLVCSRCKSREVDMVVTGTARV
jgi:hypothetical protein